MTKGKNMDKGIEKEEVFVYQYSAPESKEAEMIRRRYEKREESKLERLKRLDGKVRNAGMTESLVIGIIGIMVFGIGMCFALGALEGPMWLGVLLGAVGALVMLPAYPLYRHIAKKAKNELTPEILGLADEIIGE